MRAMKTRGIALILTLLVIGAGFYVVGTREASRPSLLIPDRIVPEEEMSRWRNLPESLRSNRYLPEAVRPALSEEELRLRMWRFVVFARRREAVLQGTASRQAQLDYYKELIVDREQRIRILEYLIPTREQFAGSSQPALRRAVVQLDELQRLRAALLEYKLFVERNEQRVELQARSAKRVPRKRVICVVDATGIVYCALEERLIDAYLAGYWENGGWKTLKFNEAQAYEAMMILDDLYSKFDLDKKKNTLVGCHNGPVMAIDTSGPALGKPKGLTPQELPSIGELQEIAKGCRALTPTVGGGYGVSPGNWLGQRSELANDTIQRIDKEINNCRESPGSGVSAGWFPRLPGLPGGVPFIPHPVEIILLVLNLANDRGPDFEAEARQREQERIEREFREREMARVLLEEQAKKLEEDAEQLERQADEEGDAAKAEEAAKKRKQAEALRREAACRATTGMSCAELEAAKKKAETEKVPQPTESSGGSEGGQLEGVNYTSCASIKAGWESFKAECERTGGWDRPGSECNELVRRANGCVSTIFINPHPDRDRSCTRIKFSEAEIYKRSCEERKKYMSAAEMLDGGCSFLHRHEFPTTLLDPCNDPAAMPVPDEKCKRTQPGAPTSSLPPPGGGQPRPVRDMVASDGILMFDALRFEGLGYAVPKNVPGIRSDR